MGELRIGNSAEPAKKTIMLRAAPSQDGGLPLELLPPDLAGSPHPTDSAMQDQDLAAQKLINALQWTFNEWDTARAPHRANWENAWRLFNNKWDFSQKEDWQSRRTLPKVTMTVKRLSATITRILSMSQEWFGTETSAPSQQKYLNIVKDLMYWYLGEDHADFESVFSTAIEVGMLSQIMPVLCTWDVDGWHHPTATDDQAMMSGSSDSSAPSMDPMLSQLTGMPNPFSDGLNLPPPKTRPDIKKFDGRLRYELLSPDNVILDPTGRFRGVIIERHYTRGEFAQEAEVRTFINVDQVMSHQYTVLDKEARENRKKGQIHTIAKDSVYIQEFWGDLYSEQGDCLLKNKYFIVANKAYIVLPPTDNPFWHGQIPLVVAGMVNVPFSVYHQGFISMNADSFELWVEFINLTIDYFQKIMIGMNEIDMDMIYDPDEQNTDVAFPGKMWKKKNSNGKPMISAVPMGDLPQGTFPFLQLISHELSDGTALTDATEGTPRTRGKQSAQEFTRRMAEAGVLLDYVYRNIEKNLIKPLITLGFKTILQFMSQKDWAEWLDRRRDKYPELSGEYDKLMGMSPVERYQLLGSDISFQTKVFSAVFDRQAVIEKLTFFIGTTGRLPFVAQYIKWGGILKKLVEALQYDAEDIVSDTPIQPMSDLMKPGNSAQSTFGGSDGGEAVPMQPPQPGQMEDQSSGLLGSSGNIPPGLDNLLPGARRPGNPRNR